MNSINKSRAAALAVLALLVCAAPNAAADDPGGFKGRTRPPPSVQVMNPYRADIQRMARMVAHVTPYRKAVVYSMVEGIVMPDPVEEGTRVSPSDTLCTLDAPHLAAAVATARAGVAQASADRAKISARVAQAEQGVSKAAAMANQARSAVNAAQADYQKAQAELEYRQVIYQRLKAVRDESPNVVSQDLVDEAKGKFSIAAADVSVAEAGIEQAKEQVKVAEAQHAAAGAGVTAAQAAADAAKAGERVAEARLAEAQVTHGFATIKSPITGVVTSRKIDTGTLVKPGGGMPLFDVLDDTRLRVWFALAAPDAPSAHAGNKVVIILEDVADPATGDKPLRIDAAITRVTEALENDTRTMKAEVELDNPKGADGRRLLRAGMFARVEVSLDTRAGALILPTRAVQTRKHKSSVFVVRPDGTVNKISVKIGIDDGHRIEVLDGVTETDQVIIKGMGLVSDGEKATAVTVKRDGK